MSTAKTGTHVQLPKLGESVTEGTIGAWLKQVGDHVERYDPLVEITTDKVNAEVPSPVAGVIIEILAHEGETLSVGAEICLIDTSNGATEPIAVEPQGRAPGKTNGAAPSHQFITCGSTCRAPYRAKWCNRTSAQTIVPGCAPYRRRARNRHQRYSRYWDQRKSYEKRHHAGREQS